MSSGSRPRWRRCANPFTTAFTYADQLRGERLSEINSLTECRWLGTHVTRCYARLRLQDVDLGPWKLCGNPARNGELWLTDDCYSARVLHTLDSTHVPPPGTNPPRVAFYHNPPLTETPPLFGPVNDKLLVLWRINPISGVPEFRVVRPIGEWPWGGTVKTDLDFPLPRTAVDLANMRFDPTDDDMLIELPGDEEGGTGGVGRVAG